MKHKSKSLRHAGIHVHPSSSIQTTSESEGSSSSYYSPHTGGAATSSPSAASSASSSEEDLEPRSGISDEQEESNDEREEEEMEEDEERDRTTELTLQIPSSPRQLQPSMHDLDSLDRSGDFFNDGTLSPMPADPYSYWNDAYAAAWNCMSEKEEDEHFNSPDYQYFSNLLQDGRLVVSKDDLPNIERWRALGFFLSKNTDVQSLRFHGVDLQVSDFYTFKQVLVKSSLANHHRPKKRTVHPVVNVSGYSTDCSSSSLSSSCASSAVNSPAAAETIQSQSSHTVTESLWTGGWGLDIDTFDSARRRREIRLRHIAFIDNNIGAQKHFTQTSEEKHSHQTLRPPSLNTKRSNTTRTTGLENVISLLLFCELLESCHIWRNNLTDSHAIQLTEELLMKHPSLRKLSLRWNGVTADGARQIETILKKCTAQNGSNSPAGTGGMKFEDLDLSFNRIDMNELNRPAPTVVNGSPIRATSQLNSITSPPPAAARYSINLRSQMPHSAVFLASLLKFSSPYQPWSSQSRLAPPTTCATASRLNPNYFAAHTTSSPIASSA